MSTSSKWSLSKEEQLKFIAALTEELAPLRAKLGISQGEIAYLVGISRQTYSLIECKKKTMSWSVYLALVLFFDYNAATHQMIRNISAFPNELVDRFNNGLPFSMFDDGFILGQQASEIAKMMQSLDGQGLHSLKTVLLVEYARCANLPGDAVVKAFDGIEFTLSSGEMGTKAAIAIKNIKKKSDG